MDPYQRAMSPCYIHILWMASFQVFRFEEFLNRGFRKRSHPSLLSWAFVYTFVMSCFMDLHKKLPFFIQAFAGLEIILFISFLFYNWPSFLRTWFLENSSIYQTKSHGPFNLANKALIKYLYLTNLLLTNSSLHRTKIS